MLASKLTTSLVGGSSSAPTSDEVFSTYLYTGNGSTQTINNGIDLAGSGGMVILKSRQNAYPMRWAFSPSSGVFTSNRSDSTQEYISSQITAFNSNGYTIGSGNDANQSGDSVASWTFKRAPKFFDVVTYTGDGSTSLAINHALGAVPGLVLIKATNTTSHWFVWHRGSSGTPNNDYLLLNQTAAVATSTNAWSSNAFTSTQFFVSSALSTNVNGNTYVAYLFAHDTSAEGIIQCGSFTTDGSGNATVNLGWEPQYLMWKRTDGTGDWKTVDSMRRFTVAGSVDDLLYPNLSSAEVSSSIVAPTATGFTVQGEWAPSTHVYLAIRRPNKPPTTGTQVYNAIARTGTGAAATVTGVGFAPDLGIAFNRLSVGNGSAVFDRLRGSSIYATTASTVAEASVSPNGFLFDAMDGVKVAGTQTGFNASAETYINHFFKRAPGVFDIVCYTGTGSATTIPHSLGVVPELIILKCRNTSYEWKVRSSFLGVDNALALNTAAPDTNAAYWNSTTPTASVFSLGSAALTNLNSGAFIAYLFATKSGISKVGNFTGNGGTQTIDCGFSTGARFVMCKRADSTGNWIIADSVRGLSSSSDPALYLNSTAAEVTGVDWIDPNPLGFDIVQEGTMNANINGATYIYLAFS